MIKLEHVVLASPDQMEFIIEGMRNPMNSWEKSDSKIFEQYDVNSCEYSSLFDLGENDHSLMQRLANAGTDHRKFMRMMPVYVRITAPLYWWKEFDTYKVGTVANSCSTMHKIQEKEFTLEDFSTEHLSDGAKRIVQETIYELNTWRERYLDYDELSKSTKDELNEKYPQYKKDIWWQMIQLLPSSYNQTRNAMMNYEVLVNIYHSRKNHKLDEWREFCKWIETLPYSELITTGIPYMKRAVNIEDETDEILTPNEQREKLGLEPIEDPINFEAIVDKLNSIGCPNPITSEEINAAIDKKDLVEVTRCKNCQFYISKENMKKDDMYANYMDDLNNADGFCVNGDVFNNEDDFCSCAEM